MSEKFKPFDAASATIVRGVNVVEASAGTGKTYAIAMLVLRFVAEFGVPLEELLVVSYTRAATEELRSRIRARLVEAREILTGAARSIDNDNCDCDGDGDDDDDPALLSCLMQLPDKRLALERLELALLDMDRAAVFTIHGFCQRMLQEQALESGQLFDMELTADVSQVQNELVADYWRKSMYELPPFHCSLFLSRFASPESLHKSVRGVGAEDSIEPEDRIAVNTALQAVDATLESLKGWWQANSAALKKCFLEAIESGMFKKDFSGNFAFWWEECSSFLAGDIVYLPSDLQHLGRDSLKSVLHGNKLRGDAKKSAFLEAWPLAEDEIESFLAVCDAALLAIRIHLALELQSGLQERLIAQGRFSFDDLVVSLARALDGAEHNDLQKILAKRFQVALIDEFQDTDAAQYRIFSTLFGGKEKEHYLFLIGDPKQAIYKFRGADIYAYFQAKKSADQLLGLEKNYRSNPLLVDAVNTLFSQKDNPFVTSQLPYHNVSAAKATDCWQVWQDGEPRAAMVYNCLESPDAEGAKPWTAGKCRQRLLSLVIAEVAILLDSGSLRIDTGEKRRITAGDIAILVRTNKQAEAFQEALALASIPSVMSSRKSVFSTRECRDLLLVTKALAVPSDIRLLRAALSCKWFGMRSGNSFHTRTQEEHVMEAWVERFHDYHRLWLEKGFLTMMNTLFSREAVFETLGTLPLAERQISNLMHLVELLQEAESSQNLSCSHTLQYLVVQVESGEGNEHAELRLESDEEAVKVVTMHAVKGLEYPIVFCPYLWHRSGYLQREKECIGFHDEEGQRISDLGTDQFMERRSVALQEELAEEVRLLYVALTRASCRTYVYWADVNGVGGGMPSKESALAWVLNLKECKTIGEQTARVAALCDGESVELRTVLSEADVVTGKGQVLLADENLHCRTRTRETLTGEWLLTSYSALAGQSHAAAGGQAPLVAEAGTRKIYDLPFGAAFGNVVHGLLEDYPFSRLAGEEDYSEEVLAQCNRFGVKADAEQLMSLIRDVTRSSLGPFGEEQKSYCLAELAEQDVLKEMPFYFKLREESTERINTLLAFSDVVQPIQERKLKGYLTGFVDLVSRHNGQYFVIDYKSNYLGDTLAHYSRDFLVSAMQTHNYGLQYWIYTLVLHRFLANSIAGYEYDRDFGGVLYLFARGMCPDIPGNGVYYSKPQLSILDALHTSLGAG